MKTLYLTIGSGKIRERKKPPSAGYGMYEWKEEENLVEILVKEKKRARKNRPEF